VSNHFRSANVLEIDYGIGDNKLSKVYPGMLCDVPLAKLTTAKRQKLNSGQYACPIDRKLPINDAAHVRNAMARFDQVESKFCHPATARRRILAAAKKFGVDASEFKKVKNFMSTKKEG
jgi:hypothetical protein